MNFMIAFGLASIMLCIGMILRTRMSFLKNMLVPTSVIAGILGIIVMNSGLVSGIDVDIFATIVTYLFTLTFISIGLTGSGSKEKADDSAGKDITKGTIGMAFVWNILYALTPVIGVIIILLIGGYFGMNALYGLLIPFALHKVLVKLPRLVLFSNNNMELKML